MKKILFIATAVAFGLAAIAQQNTDNVLKVNTEKYNFGKIKQGVPADYSFELKNIANKPIVVENAWGSCGCTPVEVPKEPIAPGATAKLKVQYNAAAMGYFEKDVFIKLAGIEIPKNLKVTGEVLDAAAYDAFIKEKGQNTKSTKPAKGGGQ